MENTEMKNGETDAVVSIIAWLDERIDRTEKTMSAGEDDFSWLADREYLQATERPLAHDSPARHGRMHGAASGRMVRDS